jgi:hypothetical protein
MGMSRSLTLSLLTLAVLPNGKAPPVNECRE